LLSELDLVFRKSSAQRVSAAGWYDAVYNKSNANDSPATNNSLSVPYNEFTQPRASCTVARPKCWTPSSLAQPTSHCRVSAGWADTPCSGGSLFYGNNAIAGTQSPVARRVSLATVEQDSPTESSCRPRADGSSGSPHHGHAGD